MDTQYLVELRIGAAEWKIGHITQELASAFQLQEYIERIPHLTLYGPFNLGDGISDDDLIEAVSAVSMPYDCMPFTIHGWELRQGLNGWVLAYRVEPSASLRSLRSALANILSPLTESGNEWDRDPSKAWFHITAANRLPLLEARAVWKDLLRRSCSAEDIVREVSGDIEETERADDEKGRMVSPFKPIFIEEDALRIAILKGETVLAEFDLLQKRDLPRDASQEIDLWQQTLQQYRRCTGREITKPHYGKDTVYLLSDTHFGHANIIRYCARPFVPVSIQEMDRVLMGNWNRIVRPSDTIYFLGDLRYGPDAAPPEYYLRSLNGHIAFISGNHDCGISPAIESITMEWDGLSFLLIHDPLQAPRGFEGWVIHGHMHNNDLDRYPFVNFERRTINVSVEVTGYRPVPSATLCRLVRGDYGKENITTYCHLAGMHQNEK